MDATFLHRFRIRWQRLLRPLPAGTVGSPVLDRGFQVAELLGLFDAYEAVSNFFTCDLRGLSPEECAFLYPIFGDSIPYSRIRIDEQAHLGPRQYRFFYVGFLTINSWGPIPPAVLVHEIVHVWQYLHLGALYIPRALAAQRSREGYDYGGLAGLRAASSLEDFNYEQMAAVIEDYFRIVRGLTPRYVGDRAGIDPECYVRFVKELKFV